LLLLCVAPLVAVAKATDERTTPLATATSGEAVITLRLVLRLERVPCLPHDGAEEDWGVVNAAPEQGQK
jgi:hypothetical protein